jgi:glycosyltransferase involved in cell wall biosynthesis
MRIGIDASSILPGKTGVGYYTLNLLRSLLTLDTKNEYVIFLNSYTRLLPDASLLKRPNVKIKQFRVPGPLLIKLWRHLHAPPIELFLGKLDLFHAASTYVPPQLAGLRIATVYDLYFLMHPEHCDTLGGKYHLHTLPRQLKRLDRIIAISNNTKNDLIRLLNIPPQKITVIYGGVDTTTFRIITDKNLLESIREEYCLPNNYILSVSTLEPRKNFEGLLFAYKRLKEILHNPPKLVIVGRHGWKAEHISETAKQLGLKRDVIFTGYVTEEHLPMIYNSALLFIVPSLYEGFGLPVLEAMACGTPVIVSNTSSLREIAKEAGITVDPHNYYEMSEKMKELITTHRLREELRDKGLEHVRMFSWELCARKTLALYTELYKTKS